MTWRAGVSRPGVWGKDYDTRLQVVRGLTLAFVGIGAMRLLVMLLCAACGGGCAEGRRARHGVSISIQVLCGWAGWGACRFVSTSSYTLVYSY